LLILTDWASYRYNSHLKYPTVDEILDFPLVKGISTESASGASSSSNVLTVLSDAVFKTWVHPQEGSLWFAAGLEVLAFEALDVRAVAVIEIDPYVSFGLFADAVCSLPPAAPRNLCYVYVELGITCRVDIKNGSFSVEGKLSPNSFLLHPSCHLVGGFALYYWFDPSTYAGDFVFSVSSLPGLSVFVINDCALLDRWIPPFLPNSDILPSASKINDILAA
jgi:hypothetical protein